jgi:cell fate regulator YaaT (PSP1 superfamily)
MNDKRLVLVQILNIERDSEYFYAAGLDLAPGDRCVVEHTGRRLGVVMRVMEAGAEVSKQFQRIVKKATEVDMEAYSRNQRDAEQRFISTKEIISRFDLPMHPVAAEYSLDRSQLRIYFTAPHRIDFRALLRELAAAYGVRIELRQMGARDETKIKGGIGRCGRPLCCHSFLYKPKPIPIELAYDQELFVSPERITGICGRLMCCLAYEHETYKRELSKLPALGTKISHGRKRGKVIGHNIFRNTVTLLTEENERIEAAASEVRIIPQRGKPDG